MYFRVILEFYNHKKLSNAVIAGFKRDVIRSVKSCSNAPLISLTDVIDENDFSWWIRFTLPASQGNRRDDTLKLLSFIQSAGEFQ